MDSSNTDFNADIYRFVAFKIKTLRNERNLSQNKFSNIVNLSRVSIANIETGNQKPTLDLIWKISERFAVGIDQFFPTAKDQLELKGKNKTISFLEEIGSRV